MTGSFRGIFLKRRGASRLHGGRSTRWVLPYQETLPNWPDVRPGLGTRLAVQSIARNGQRNVKYLSLNPLSRIFHPTDAVTVGEALSISWFAKDNQVYMIHCSETWFLQTVFVSLHCVQNVIFHWRLYPCAKTLPSNSIYVFLELPVDIARPEHPSSRILPGEPHADRPKQRSWQRRKPDG